GLHESQENSLIGSAARVRLHIGETALEELLGALDCQRLSLVHVLAAAIIALAWVTFRVLVGEHGARGLQHRARDHVLGGNELNFVALTFELAANDAGELRVAFSKCCCEERGMVRRLAHCRSGHLYHALVATREGRGPSYHGLCQDNKAAGSPTPKKAQMTGE